MSVIADPWRLACPQCDNQVHKSTSAGWYCQHCRDSITQVRDKKKNKLIGKHELVNV